MWKFYDFPISQILREINSGDSRSAKCAISTHLEAVNFHFYEFLYFLNAGIDQINKIQCLKNGKKGSFRTSRVFKIDFT